VAVQNYDARIHQGAVAPYALTFTVTSPDPATFDLSTATAAELRVKRENGSADVWPCTLSGLTTTTAILTHIFAVGDVPDIETVVLTPVVTTPSGDFFAKVRKLRVFPTHEL
jgi:hypothetical protein